MPLFNDWSRIKTCGSNGIEVECAPSVLNTSSLLNLRTCEELTAFPDSIPLYTAICLFSWEILDQSLAFFF